MFLAAQAQRHGAFFSFLAADDDNHRNALHRQLADFLVDLLVRQVGVRANTGCLELQAHVARIVIGIRHDGGDHRLHWRQPEGQAAGMVLDENAGEPLQRAEDGAMQHDRRVAVAVFADVLGIKAAGQVQVHLDGAALPVAADGIAQHELQLGAVERAFAGEQAVVDAHRLQRIGQRGFGLVPEVIGADALFRAGRELDADVVEAEFGVLRQGELGEGHTRIAVARACRKRGHRPG